MCCSWLRKSGTEEEIMKRPKQTIVIEITGKDDDLSYTARFLPDVDLQDETKNNECVVALGTHLLTETTKILQEWSGKDKTKNRKT